MKVLKISKKSIKTNLISAMFLFILGIGVLISGILIADSNSGKIIVTIVGIFFCGISIYGYSEYKRMNYQIRFDEHEISKIYPNNITESIKWDSMSNIKFRDRSQKIELHNNSDKIKIIIDYQLDMFPLLELYIAQHVESFKDDILAHYKKYYGIEVDSQQLKDEIEFD